MIDRFRTEDEGKRVTTPEGDVVGSVVVVRGGDAYVVPTPGLLAGCGSWLTGTWEDCDVFTLDPRRVAAVEEDRIVIETDTTSSRSIAIESR